MKKYRTQYPGKVQDIDPDTKFILLTNDQYHRDDGYGSSNPTEYMQVMTFTNKPELLAHIASKPDKVHTMLVIPYVPFSTKIKHVIEVEGLENA